MERLGLQKIYGKCVVKSGGWYGQDQEEDINPKTIPATPDDRKRLSRRSSGQDDWTHWSNTSGRSAVIRSTLESGFFASGPVKAHFIFWYSQWMADSCYGNRT